MSRPLIVLVVFCFFSANLYADTDREVYDEADGIFKQAEEAVSTNLATFVQANEKPLAKAREEMAELIARMNKEGRSQLATSLQKRLNGLEETVQKRVRTEVPIVVPPKKPLLERLAGKWTHPNSHVVEAYGQDGKATALWRGGKTVEGTIRPLSEVEAEVRWRGDERVVRVRIIDADTTVVRMFNADGSEQGEGFLKTRVR